LSQGVPDQPAWRRASLRVRLSALWNYFIASKRKFHYSCIVLIGFL
jgi:hypothetical protein